MDWGTSFFDVVGRELDKKSGLEGKLAGTAVRGLEGKHDVLGSKNVGRESVGGEHFWHGIGRGDDFCMGVGRELDNGFRSKIKFVCKIGWTGVVGGFSAPIPCQFSPCSEAPQNTSCPHFPVSLATRPSRKI